MVVRARRFASIEGCGKVGVIFTTPTFSRAKHIWYSGEPRGQVQSGFGAFTKSEGMEEIVFWQHSIISVVSVILPAQGVNLPPWY